MKLVLRLHACKSSHREKSAQKNIHFVVCVALNLLRRARNDSSAAISKGGIPLWQLLLCAYVHTPALKDTFKSEVEQVHFSAVRSFERWT